jgi:hypothetical protein
LGIDEVLEVGAAPWPRWRRRCYLVHRVRGGSTELDNLVHCEYHPQSAPPRAGISATGASADRVDHLQRSANRGEMTGSLFNKNWASGIASATCLPTSGGTMTSAEPCITKVGTLMRLRSTGGNGVSVGCLTRRFSHCRD